MSVVNVSYRFDETNFNRRVKNKIEIEMKFISKVKSDLIRRDPASIANICT